MPTRRAQLQAPHLTPSKSCKRSLSVSVRDIAKQADDPGGDPLLFLHVLEELETSEPADYVFQRISQRLDHAAEREPEERHVARTKKSINLAEYPESFEVASRMGRKFIALLGPTNSARPAARWKTTSVCRVRARTVKKSSSA
jgi:hypothetical protein